MLFHMKLAEVLHAWRWREEITGADAANQLGIPLSTYYKLEKPEAGAVDGKTMIAILKWLFGP